MSAFQIFAIDNTKRVPEQIAFLTNSRELYISMDIAIRSLGNQLPYSGGHVRNSRAISKVLDFQIARLEAKIPAIEKALENCKRTIRHHHARRRERDNRRPIPG
ncbi:hypothetical protein PGT21_024872 [Puccinia graminis f. sp. tritici]|uniref:Uncharacterized protein n=1 Tax=Puccinia graminis f. sp. tritici TaxID=56615 RepID=A0A5B0LUA1_PUCGR|nr:hypothetical protein PGT21_024872 [Puccinia graminis f. sp. tritici]